MLRVYFSRNSIFRLRREIFIYRLYSNTDNISHLLPGRPIPQQFWAPFQDLRGHYPAAPSNSPLFSCRG